jgi:hypothetical protein
MACPDKKRDEVIIKEVQRRKALANEPQYFYETLLFDCELQLAILGIDEKEIQKIEPTDTGWAIYIKRT